MILSAGQIAKVKAIVGAQVNNSSSQLQNQILSSAQILNIVWPVGSVYISVLSTNPETLLGGTWTAITLNFAAGSATVYAWQRTL